MLRMEAYLYFFDVDRSIEIVGSGGFGVEQAPGPRWQTGARLGVVVAAAAAAGDEATTTGGSLPTGEGRGLSNFGVEGRPEAAQAWLGGAGNAVGTEKATQDCLPGSEGCSFTNPLRVKTYFKDGSIPIFF